MLYYRVYGSVDLAGPLESARYRCAGVPDGVDLTRLVRGRHAVAMDEILANPMGDLLRQGTPEVDAIVAASTDAVHLLGVPADTTTLNYFRDTVGLIA